MLDSHSDTETDTNNKYDPDSIFQRAMDETVQEAKLTITLESNFKQNMRLVCPISNTLGCEIALS